MRENITYLIGIAQRITEQECAWTSEMVYERDYTPEFETVKEAYERDGVKWGPLVEHDVKLVLSGYMPEYFLGWQEWQELYRLNHSILYQSPEPKTVYGKDTLRPLARFADELAREDMIYHLHEISGWACPTEQTYFYNSAEWQRLAKATRFIWGYRCRRCGTSRNELHVHHESPIKSAYSAHFSDNFADWKLTIYCKDCHDWFHRHFSRELMANDFSSATPEEIAKDKKYMASFWKRYHAEGKCEFCNKHRV